MTGSTGTEDYNMMVVYLGLTVTMPDQLAGLPWQPWFGWPLAYVWALDLRPAIYGTAERKRWTGLISQKLKLWIEKYRKNKISMKADAGSCDVVRPWWATLQAETMSKHLWSRPAMERRVRKPVGSRPRSSRNMSRGWAHWWWNWTGSLHQLLLPQLNAVLHPYSL